MNEKYSNRLGQAYNIQQRINGAAERTLAGLPEVQNNLAKFREDIHHTAHLLGIGYSKEKEADDFYQYWLKYGQELHQKKKEMER